MTGIGIGVSEIFVKLGSAVVEECAGPEDTIMDDNIVFLIDDNGDCIVDD